MRFLFLLLVLLFCKGVLADDNKVKKQRPPFRPGHEFFLGVGALSLPAADEEDDLDFNSDHALIHFDGDTYRGSKYTSGIYTLGYSYAATRWLNVCFTSSYSVYWRKIYEHYTDREMGRTRTHYMGFVPSLRLTWMNSGTVRMYSTLGVGVTVKYDKKVAGTSAKHSVKYLTAPEVAVWGLSVGKKYYGFVEIGPNHRGAISAGVGYRFDCKADRRLKNVRDK